MDTIGKIITATRSHNKSIKIEAIIKEEIRRDRIKLINEINKEHAYDFSDFIERVEIELS